MGRQQDELRTILNEMDMLFHPFFPWLAGQFDERSGGFYYARSSRRLVEQKPDVESTAQALNILQRCGLLDTMPNHLRVSLIRFFQRKQEPNSGYFLDDHPHMREDEVMMARALNYSQGALRKLGGAPLHALPLDSQAAPAYMESPATYKAWLRSVALDNSWRGCDRLAISSVYLHELPPTEQQAYLEVALAYFAEIQHPLTGLWGEGSPYVQVSGTFKLHTFYNSYQVPLPRAARIVASIQQCLRDEIAHDMCYIRNPIHLLSYMKPELSIDEKLEIIRITQQNLQKLLRADGGFSRELAHSPKAPNVAQVKEGEYYPDMPKPVEIGCGDQEGDMNAGTQAILIRHLCYQMAGIAPPELPGVQSFYKHFD